MSAVDMQRLAAAHRDASAAADRAADRLTAEGHLADGMNLADRWRSARAEADRIRDLLADAVRAAADEGATEYRIAQATGLTRSTVRDMLGKPRGGTP